MRWRVPYQRPDSAGFRHHLRHLELGLMVNKGFAIDDTGREVMARSVAA